MSGVLIIILQTSSSTGRTIFTYVFARKNTERKQKFI